MHWAKIVTQDKEWRWLRADQGACGYIKRNPPLHIYQTLLRYQGTAPPRGYESEGYLLGGPILFEMDASTKGEPCNLWTLIDLIYSIEELREILTDYGQYRITRVMFSGFRGVHVIIKSSERQSNPIRFPLDQKNRNLLRDLIKERKQLARSIGKWCSGWDWRVSEDIWRVARVPWSIHGKSSLRAITLQPPYTSNNMQSQLRHASPFSLQRKINIRISRSVPLFTFVDGEIYGPYRKGWRAKLPLAVAVHLIWLMLTNAFRSTIPLAVI